MAEDREFALEIIKGVEGSCVALNDFRIAGAKPWGGGTVTKSWTVTVDDLLRAIPGLRYEPEGTMWRKQRIELADAGHALGLLALQSDRYHQDVEYREATDAMLAALRSVGKLPPLASPAEELHRG